VSKQKSVMDGLGHQILLKDGVSTSPLPAYHGKRRRPYGNAMVDTRDLASSMTSSFGVSFFLFLLVLVRLPQRPMPEFKL
jgi:hypothetical protein